MKKYTLHSYHKWTDIKTEICKEMGIEEKDFRDYHHVVGGEYKDLWHEWLGYFDDVKNDTIVYNELGEHLQSKLEWIKNDDKEWLEPFVVAVYKVWNKYGIEYIQYLW